MNFHEDSLARRREGSDSNKLARPTVEAGPRPNIAERIALSGFGKEWKFLAHTLERRLDILVTDEEFDIVAEGYDAGVRLGEVIEQDMIAVSIAGDERQLAVCSPSYRKRFGAPSHPKELAAHRCIGWRPAPKVMPYRWEFAEYGKEFSVAVDPAITTNDMALMIKLAIAGAGITFGMEESFRPLIERGELVPLLAEFCPYFAGFYLYYPSRRNVAPKLRALVRHAQQFRTT